MDMRKAVVEKEAATGRGFTYTISFNTCSSFYCNSILALEKKVLAQGYSDNLCEGCRFCSRVNRLSQNVPSL